MVALFTGLGFLTILAELVLTDHTEGIRIPAPLAAGMGAGAIPLAPGSREEGFGPRGFSSWWGA